MSDKFEQILATANPKVATLARQAKALLQDVMPAIVEVVWPKQNIAGYGIGPKKMSEHFCYIGVYKARINLGFYYGADLPDPESLLEGSGKKLRHIKISQPAQLENPAVRDLVLAASTYLPNLK